MSGEHAVAARAIGELSLPDALAFCLLLAEVDPLRFDRAIARWHARFVLVASGITADEAALALSAAKGLAGLKTRELGAQTLRKLADGYGLEAIATVSATSRRDTARTRGLSRLSSAESERRAVGGRSRPPGLRPLGLRLTRSRRAESNEHAARRERRFLGGAAWLSPSRHRLNVSETTTSEGDQSEQCRATRDS